MAIKTQNIKLEKEQLLAYIPRLSQAAVVLIFIFLIFIPLVRKIAQFNRDIKERESSLVVKERGYYDATELKKDLLVLEKEAQEDDRRIPYLIETNMLIDSLKAITREARLKFISIEPMDQVKFELPDTDSLYHELPIRINLKCGFFELVEFIKKIEDSKKLMKVTSLTIGSDSENPWEHNVEMVISSFARGDKQDKEGEK